MILILRFVPVLAEVCMNRKMLSPALLTVGVLLGGCTAGLDANESAVLQAVEKVVGDYKTLATCYSLEPVSYRFQETLQEVWLSEVQSGANALRKINPSATLIARFASAVEPSRLLDENMRLSEAIALCHEPRNEELVMNFQLFEFPRLDEAIDKAVDPGAQ
ncbi:MAG: hypothetical protein LBE59_01490 [Nevskiaceae bacterium]|jgi:hypothetical protein|nr:hypothetical protein [Nevskiaceae bacterium]